MNFFQSFTGQNSSTKKEESLSSTKEGTLDEEGVTTVHETASVHSNSGSLNAAERPKHNQLTRRRLKPRHIQLIGMGGTIATALFLQMGGSLMKGGPGSLFIAFALWAIPIILVTNCAAEMVTIYPLPSPFVQLAGRCVDEALAVAAGYAFYILEALLLPFEITSVTLIIHYWRDDFTPAATIVPQLAIYVFINMVVPVNWFGEIEFWMAILKVLLIMGLILFTFITMVGGNPKHDAYGFRYWNDPGAFLEFVGEGSMGRFLGFFSCLSMAAFTVSGPEYVSMTAGEAINPRTVLPIAYKGVVFRLTIFFVVGALAMGIVCPADDPRLVAAYSNGGSSNAAGSPYVAGMVRMGIPVLPSVVNVGILSSSFSAGNSYFFTSSRTLYGMALKGHAPKVFTWCLPNGVPYMSVLVSIGFAMLAWLQMSSSAVHVLNLIIGAGTVCMTIIYSIIAFTYLRFYKACKAQGVDRSTFPYTGYFQPYSAYIALVANVLMTFLAGHEVFLKGQWDVGVFITNYIMIPISICIFIVWKVWKKTRFLRPEEVDLRTGLEEVTEHEKHVEYRPPRNWMDRTWRTIIGDI